MSSTVRDGKSGPAPSQTPKMSFLVSMAIQVLDHREPVPVSRRSSVHRFLLVPFWEATTPNGLILLIFHSVLLCIDMCCTVYDVSTLMAVVNTPVLVNSVSHMKELVLTM